jgi:hypothetical protein
MERNIPFSLQCKEALILAIANVVQQSTNMENDNKM